MSNALVAAPAQVLMQNTEALGQTLSLFRMMGEANCMPSGMKPAEAMLCASLGAAYGWNPLESCQRFHVVKGNVVMKADVMVGIAKGHPACKYFVCTETTTQAATYETLRAGSPKAESVTFTMEDARRAGVLSNGTWKKYPAQMLRARASSALVRMVYPDVIAGIYTADEMGRPDIEADDPNTVDAEFTETPRRAEPEPRQLRQSNPPRREQPSAGAGGDEEAQRQAELDNEFAQFTAACDSAGLTTGRIIYALALGKSPEIDSLRAWNSPRRWRNEYHRMQEAALGGSAQALSGRAAALIKQAAQKAGHDEAEALAHLQAAIKRHGADYDAEDRAVGACLLAERCIRKPETFKALGLSREEG